VIRFCKQLQHLGDFFPSMWIEALHPIDGTFLRATYESAACMQDPYLLVAMPVPDCGRFWRIWRRRPVRDADDLGLCAGNACLARGRFVTDTAAPK
jgi:hypothetical protein